MSNRASKAINEVDEFIIKARQLDTPAHAKELQISIDSEVLTAHVKQVQQAKPDNIMAVAALKKITLEVEKVTKNLEKKNRKEGRTRPVMRTWMPKPSPTLLIGLKKCVEATVAFVGKEDNFCPKVKKSRKRGRDILKINQMKSTGSLLLACSHNQQD